MKKINYLSLLSIFAALAVVLTAQSPPGKNPAYSESGIIQKITPSAKPPSPTPTPTLPIPLIQKTLESNYHIFQTFNNCGSASLSMALSYYGINVNQQELGNTLRPYQNPKGDNDDKSVTLQELAQKAEEYGLLAYHRPNGDIEKIKMFITYNIPVVARTLTKPDEDIGHYRVVKGYDNTASEIVQDDSLQGKNLRFKYDGFLSLWKVYNYEYLVLAKPEDKGAVEQILGPEIDPVTAWQQAATNTSSQIEKDPDDIYAKFNLSVALYNIGDFQGSVKAFEDVEKQLPFRTLWYNIEPILSYYELGNYERVFQLTDRVLSNHNRAFSELYLIRGEIYKKQRNISAARDEFEKAVFYNKNLKEAQEALENI